MNQIKQYSFQELKLPAAEKWGNEFRETGIISTGSSTGLAIGRDLAFMLTWPKERI
ncbi:MAG: hypothetical protein WBK43_01995 [Prolixibacteraceae bacterium]|nr:hypothetical protein [Prolixibacteraceae bacterium]HNZ69778.1 hypothetical protein [Prolixibacteraceae bacterium]HOC86766.1 hypothetical protein [Prolixibacteraceae bacterium]HOG96665.1 hypothetical protein [Prolixibacteraceae bacterium]HPV19759.1 hypothetical protein [Prolixibacteraceae bacterium]